MTCSKQRFLPGRRDNGANLQDLLQRRFRDLKEKDIGIGG